MSDLREGGPLLQFPVDYPIKVVCRRSDGLRQRIDAIVQQHVPDLVESQVSERASKEKHFLSITYTINAQSGEQVIALANALQASPDVVMLI